MASIIDVLSTVQSPVKAGLIKKAIEVFPAMTFLNFEDSASIVHKMFLEGKLPAAAYRNYNTTFSSSTIAADDAQIMQMQPFGLKVPIDHILAMEQTRSEGDYKAKARGVIGRSIGLDFKTELLGNTRAISAIPRGIYQWVNHWHDVSTNFISYSMGTNGLKISGTNGVEIFVTALTNLWIRVRPTFFATNASVIATILTQIRAQATNAVYAAEFSERTINVLGRDVVYITFKGIPILDIGETSQLTSTMPFTETQGGGTTCSSVIAVRSDEDNVTVVTRFKDLIDYREYVESGQDVVEGQMPFLIQARHPRSVGRLNGILAE